jgi:hypothetical protein
MAVITGIDVLGIQSYVFGSNRLRDVLSASWMVEFVTSTTALAQWGVDTSQILLNAGGNAILELDTLHAAKVWAAHYSRWIYDNAPGLEVVVAHREIETRSLAWALKALQIDLARTKVERVPSAPQLGLSVTASCAATGLPATNIVQGDLVSPRIKCLREQQAKAKERWARFLPALPHAPSRTASFPDELDRMGRSHGDTSTLGVVHVDGNSIGKAIAGWLDRCLEDDVDDTVVRDQYRAWSAAISGLGDAVLRAVVQRTGSAIHEATQGSQAGLTLKGTPNELSFDLRRDGSEVHLPIRPLLLGGDDLTFVCDGRVALDLAAVALEEFAKHRVPHLGEGGGETALSACAGVALVKAHAPFFRSYQLAEALCASAKRGRRDANDRANADTGSWLDWHAGTTRPGESVEEIRNRQFRRGQIKLTMRPYPHTASAHRQQSWRWLERDILGSDDCVSDAFRSRRQHGNAWSGSRSRVKLLGQLVREGGDAVKRQLEAWRAIESAVSLPGNLQDTGFVGDATPLLDAIELMDLHLRLGPDPRDGAANPAGSDKSQEGR